MKNLTKSIALLTIMLFTTNLSFGQIEDTNDYSKYDKVVKIDLSTTLLDLKLKMDIADKATE